MNGKPIDPKTVTVDSAKLLAAFQTIEFLAERALAKSKDAEAAGAPNLAFAYAMQQTAFEAASRMVSDCLGSEETTFAELEQALNRMAKAA